jgi:hypothetical protein
MKVGMSTEKYQQKIKFFIFSMVPHKTGIIGYIVSHSMLHGVLKRVDMPEQLSGPQEPGK